MIVQRAPFTLLEVTHSAVFKWSQLYCPISHFFGAFGHYLFADGTQAKLILLISLNRSGSAQKNRQLSILVHIDKIPPNQIQIPEANNLVSSVKETLHM